VILPSPAALAAWLPEQRWFAGKARRIEGVVIEAAIPLGGAALVVARVGLDDGVEDRYALPLALSATPLDVLAEPAFAHDILAVMASGARVAGDAGAITGRPTLALSPALPEPLTVRKLGGEQSNTSVAFGDAIALKQFRRWVAGVNPEEEITRFLTERTPFAHAPKLLGSLAYEPTSGAAGTLAVAHEFVVGSCDGWSWMLERLRELDGHLGPQSGDEAVIRRLASTSLDALYRLGERTGELHAALASDGQDPDFAPEPITGADIAGWAEGVHRQVDAARAAVGGQLPVEIPDVGAALAGLAGGTKIRHHGDFHLGQTLYVPARADFIIIDFEGEPLRPLAERRRKHAAIRDVAGLTRSISYAAAGLGAPAATWPKIWEAEGTRAFVAGYLAVARGHSFIPVGPAAFDRALAAFELEKAAYEIVYEASHRPAWLPIPVRGLVSAVARIRAVESSASA
jgi:maltose alpha-D-glucosyltransferase / alpha-amylase